MQRFFFFHPSISERGKRFMVFNSQQKKKYFIYKSYMFLKLQKVVRVGLYVREL